MPTTPAKSVSELTKGVSAKPPEPVNRGEDTNLTQIAVKA
jgi:hypothetical protein